ncbi:MAG: zinc-ribbon domain-containing protein [Paracoccaceae bacterium]|nr:zinc-ribbon domain-containing protein [Paracoccaceae bacterium]
MRLTCPNCGAQYEVDDRAIPEAGRDVQCSNCSHTWFQVSAAAQAAEAAIAASAAEPAPALPETAEAEDSAPQAEAAEDRDAGAADGAAHEAAADMPQTVRPQRRRPLDENIQAVLREEAEREKRAREAEGPVQIQPELGVPAPAPAPKPAAAPSPVPVPDIDEDEDDLEEPHQPQRGSRRNLLPDIEQINSTLRAGGQADFPAPSPDSDSAAVEQEQNRRGFRRGFSYAVVILVLILVLYRMGPALSQRYPALAGPLNGLHAAIDQYRAWLDQKVMAAVDMINKHR